MISFTNKFLSFDAAPFFAAESRFSGKLGDRDGVLRCVEVQGDAKDLLDEGIAFTCRKGSLDFLRTYPSF